MLVDLDKLQSGIYFLLTSSSGVLTYIKKVTWTMLVKYILYLLRCYGVINL